MPQPSAPVQSHGQDLCWGTVLCAAPHYVQVRCLGFWGCELTPLVLSHLSWTSFFTGCSHRVLERERTEYFSSRTASLAAGLGPVWAQCFP